MAVRATCTPDRKAVVNDMKIVFVSNYFNHHQRPLCEALLPLCDSFYFIATSEMREERKKLGYAFEEPPYVIRAYVGDGAERAKGIFASADVVIRGSAVGEWSKPACYRGKTVFYYSERIYKRGCRRWLLPLRAIQFYFKYTWRQNSILLCASGYAAYDFSLTRTFRDKCFRWGYFPETKQYDIKKLIAQKDSRKILWCGRLIDWKHPELAVETAARLRNAGVEFSMDIIGSGAMESELRKQIEDHGLADRVKLLGSMPPQKAREHMERAGILLFTSDRQEGWGAVLNEAMNSGCAVVASHAAGSAPYLIRNGENGMIYSSGDCDGLIARVRYLLENPNLQKRMGTAAYQTILHMWNADLAAKRFLTLAEQTLKGETRLDLFTEGPCSKAKLLSDNWM